VVQIFSPTLYFSFSQRGFLHWHEVKEKVPPKCEGGADEKGQCCRKADMSQLTQSRKRRNKEQLCNVNQQKAIFKSMFYFNSSCLLHVSTQLMFIIRKATLYLQPYMLCFPCFGISCFCLHVLSYNIAAFVLYNFSFMFLYWYICFACLTLANFMPFVPCIVI
jgi:hypothetical protein